MEPEPQHDRTEPEDRDGGEHNEHWDWGRSDAPGDPK